MRRVLVFSLLIVILIPAVNAQRWKLKRWEGVVGIGTFTISGDIGTISSEENLYWLKDATSIQTSRPAIDLGVRYRLYENQSLKFSIRYGYSKGDDKNGTNDLRKLVYKSNLIEPALQYEYYILEEDRRLKSSAIFNRRGMINNYARTSLYATAGVAGFFSFTKHEAPEDAYGDPLNDPKHTFKSPGIGLSIPVGLGLKYSLDSRTSLGFEFGYRYALSDYVDGFASTWTEGSNDAYYFTTITLVYKVRTDRRGRPILFR